MTPFHDPVLRIVQFLSNHAASFRECRHSGHGLTKKLIQNSWLRTAGKAQSKNSREKL